MGKVREFPFVYQVKVGAEYSFRQHGSIDKVKKNSPRSGSVFSFVAEKPLLRSIIIMLKDG